MDSMNLMPVGDSGWSNGGAAALGAFVGSRFGNGGFGGDNRGAAITLAREADVTKPMPSYPPRE